MSLEDFQMTRDNEATDNSFIKRDFFEFYHQQAANSNDSDQNIKFMFGENNKYHQVGNANLQYKKTIEKDVAVAANRVLVNRDAIRLGNNAFAFCFKECRLSTTGGSDIEHNFYGGQVSSIMTALTSKDGGLLSHFDKIDESEAEIENTSPHHIRKFW